MSPAVHDAAAAAGGAAAIVSSVGCMRALSECGGSVSQSRPLSRPTTSLSGCRMSSGGWGSPLPASRGFQRGNTSPSQAQSRSLLQQSPRAARVASPLPLPTSPPALPAVPSNGYRSSSHVETNKNVRRTSESETEEAATAQLSSQLTSSPATTAAARLSSSVSSTTSSSSSTSSSRSTGVAADPLPTSPPPSSSAATATTPPSSSSSSSSQSSGRTDPSGWEEDDAVHECRGCSSRFSLFLRKHHCRQCGLIYCDGCSRNRRRVRGGGEELVRVCDKCDGSISREGEDDRQRAADSASVQPTQLAPRPSPSPPPASSHPHAEQTSASTAQRRQPQHQTSQSLSSIPSVTLTSSFTSPSSASAPSDTAAAAASADSGDRSALVSALLDELLCAEAVLRHAKLVRDEMEVTVMQLVTEIVEREREATTAPSTAAAAENSGKKLEVEAGAGGAEAEEQEMKQLRCRVDELQRENARLRARLEQQTVR